MSDSRVTKPASEDTLDTIAAAFSKTAEKYDQFAGDHPHLTQMRRKVYARVMLVVPPQSRILELNCGSGTDAVYLAEQGYHVHATDIATGMLKRLEAKVAEHGLQGRVTHQVCSYLDLANITGGPYDAVFSDLGGLNCARDLSDVARQLRLVLKPGGAIIWVLMPPICLWELAMVFAGQFRYAFRRLKRGGAVAHLEGQYFPVTYFTPERAVRALGPEFHVLGIEGLSVITPTAESKNLAKRFTRLYRTLAWLDDRLAPRWPWRGWGDFYILSARYQP